MGKLTGKVAVVTGARKASALPSLKHTRRKALGRRQLFVEQGRRRSRRGGNREARRQVRRGARRHVEARGHSAAVRRNRESFRPPRHPGEQRRHLRVRPLEQITPEHFHKQFNLNVLGLILASQEAAKQFGDAGGVIINISSIAATAAPPTTAVYSATKGAVDTITKVLAKELGPRKSASTPSTRA